MDTGRPIRTEEDYDDALADVGGLMDAEPGTPEGARLDGLVTLVEAYEECHWAIDRRHRASVETGDVPPKRRGRS